MPGVLYVGGMPQEHTEEGKLLPNGVADFHSIYLFKNPKQTQTQETLSTLCLLPYTNR